jgi:hypothetical protein
MSLNCTFCNKVCKNKTGLSIHISKCQTVVNKCIYCNKDFGKNLKRHMEDKCCKGYLEYIEKLLKMKTQENENINKNKEEILLETEKLKQKILDLNNNIEKNKELSNDKIINLKNDIKNQQEKIHILEIALDVNKTLANKVGNNTYNNSLNQVNTINNTINLPALTDEIIGNKINNILVDHTLNNLNVYCKKLSLETFAYLSDASRNNLVFNNGKRDIKDKEGEILSTKIASHPNTKKKKEEIELFLNEQKKYAKYEDKYFNDNLVKIEELNKNLDNVKLLKEEIPSVLKNKDYLIENKECKFMLNNFMNNLIMLFQKYPAEILFQGSPVELITTSKYIKDRFKLIVIDDNDKDYILTEHELLIIMINIYNSLSFTKPMTENEIKAFIKIFNITEEYFETYFNNFQRNIKWLSELKQDNKESLERIKELLDDIKNY